MSANTVVMYFKVDPNVLQAPGTKAKLMEMLNLVLGKPTAPPVDIDLGGTTDRLLVCHSENQSHAILRIYHHGLVTLDIQHYIPQEPKSFKDMTELDVRELYGLAGAKPHQLSEEKIFDDDFSPEEMEIYRKYVRTLEAKLANFLGDICVEHNSVYVPIIRGQKVWPYTVTSDERILESDFDKLLFEKKSKWQTIKIYHSRLHGNVLLLDGELKSDLIYTQKLCGIGKENYKDKEVLILGGGDGGILHELLKEEPKFITMAEIDIEVIKACRVHLRGVCGDSMDKLEGQNYKIIIDDCVEVLIESIKQGREYDYVINDLPELPVEKDVKGFNYDFATSNMINELSIKAVKPGGKLLARGNCLGAIDYNSKFEDDLRTLGCVFKRKEFLVPSFQEDYCVYEIWRNKAP